MNNAQSRRLVLAGLFVVALFAFELFNFDTTRFALTNVLGEPTFAGISWSTILAIAFCAIDFAGLAHMFTPQSRTQPTKEAWYLMGAWLLGATMNALMTWWAVSLTLLNHELGNEILSREELLNIVPIFVATLVWLTRILFIGGLSAAGEQWVAERVPPAQKKLPVRRPVTLKRQATRRVPVTDEMPAFLHDR